MDEGPINVLIADDDEAFLASLRELVDRQPELHVVGTALNGAEVIELAGRLAPHAAVIDLHMPFVDGATAITQLRQDHPHLCLIALTGDSDPGLHQSVRLAGADAVLEKSEMVSLLIDRLTKARAAR